MRKLVSGFAVAAFLALGSTQAQGQVQVGPTLAVSDDVDVGIGATLSAQAPQLDENLGFIGEFILFFPEGSDYFEINGNATYSFPLAESTVLPFVLGGLNIARASYDVDAVRDVSDTEIGINLGGGITFDAGSFRPSIGGRFAINDLFIVRDHFVFFATLPFEVGGG